MLAYTVVFGLLSIAFVHDDFGQYPAAFTVFDGFGYIVILIGNLLFSLTIVTPLIKTLWKFVFPFVIAHFISTGIISSCYGKHAHDGHSMSLDVIVWVIGFALFFPTFRAQLLLGYGHDEV